MAKIKIKRKRPALWYVGSTVQQNFGESFEGHGYALVNLKQDISYEFHDISNDYGFYTLDIDNGNLPPNLPITSKTNVRLRVKNTSPADLKRVLATIRKNYKNSDVLVQKLDKSTSGGSSAFGESLTQEDIRNVQYQNQLILDYLQGEHLDEEAVQAITKINENLNRSLELGDAVRNVIWKPKRFEFSNMFSYGENNVVNFGKLEGTCGLFAPNHAGKSAVLDALCFCLFDHSFRASKAEQVLNRKKDGFWCKFSFELNRQEYYIEKTASRYAKGPLAGKLRVDINFWCVNEDGEKIPLNGEQRKDTNRIIQSYVGSFDDFILTALSLQGNNSNFIDKTQSERKDLLANFLDLKIFDNLYELANKETKTTSILLEEYIKQDFETKLGDAEKAKDDNEEKHEKAAQVVQNSEQQLQTLTDELMELHKKVQPCKADGLDIIALNTNLKTTEDRLKRFILQLQQAQPVLDEAQKDLNSVIAELDTQKKTFNETLYREYLDNVQQKVKLDNTLANFKVTIANKLSKLEKLKEHEYDPNCKYCVENVFVKDANETKKELEEDKKTIHSFLAELNTVASFIEENKSIQQQADTIQILIKKHSEARSNWERQDNTRKACEKDISIEEHKLMKLQSDIKTYNDNLAIIETNKTLHDQIKTTEGLISNKRSELNKQNNVVKDYHGKIKVSEQVILECENSIKHMRELAEKQQYYDLYCKAICKDGIPYLLISKAVPYIEQYVNNILNQVIDFTVQLETDGKNINVFICYEDNKWPLELSSGMERFISSLAIRIALIKITNLPKPDFIAIDEGLGVLDSTNLNSMHTLFTYLKDIFRFNMVISHIDVVRDMVDTILTVDRKDEFSYINC